MAATKNASPIPLLALNQGYTPPDNDVPPLEGGQMARTTGCMLRFVLLCTVLTPFASAQSPGTIPAPSQGVADRHAATESFDIKAAVDVYLAKMPPAERARSNAYFEGGYWLLLGDFLSTVVVMWLLLRFRWSMRMRDLAERTTRFRTAQTAVYWVQFLIVVSV